MYFNLSIVGLIWEELIVSEVETGKTKYLGGGEDQRHGSSALGRRVGDI